jgi:uncharacterized protein involved in exopolysaccharide biosynthesis
VLALFRTLTLIMGLLAFSQAPEFMQQYRQRLGGALDELSRLVAEFDQDAGLEGLDRTQALTSYLTSNNEFLARRGVRAQEMFARQATLRSHAQDLQQAGLISGLMAVADLHDAALLQNSWADYRMAVPVTPDGVVIAAAGACTGWVLGGILAWLITLPFRRRRTATDA